MDLINIASGYLPLSLSDVDRGTFTKVVNFDPLEGDDRVTGIYGAILHDIKKQDPSLHVTRSWSEVDALCRDANANLILAISPYGFTVVTAQVDQKLAEGGWVLLVGSSKNPFLKPAKAFADGVRSRYRPVQYWPKWLDSLKDRILKSYPSQTSKLEHETKLDSFAIYQKHMPSRGLRWG